eukprot:TRINITY_DN28389_c0_g1_i2.p1 TRINITY_DN28389_c0_g1~~TRINITY_DN28389_c0_g1_i2.p1  ORF type:complete len:118 (-),score=11.06 TRINITY_DN28389_c0_g1_i2:29-382(-)
MFLVILCKSVCVLFREGIGNYHVYLDVEDEPFICYGASVFMNPESNTYLYRSKFGNWIVGKNMGKVKGAIIRSQEDDREKFALVCPCKVQKWQVHDKEAWKFDDSIRIMIRRNKKVF